jgi:hypothetical protein
MHVRRETRDLLGRASFKSSNGRVQQRIEVAPPLLTSIHVHVIDCGNAAVLTAPAGAAVNHQEATGLILGDGQPLRDVLTCCSPCKRRVVGRLGWRRVCYELVEVVFQILHLAAYLVTGDMNDNKITPPRDNLINTERSEAGKEVARRAPAGAVAICIKIEHILGPCPASCPTLRLMQPFESGRLLYRGVRGWGVGPTPFNQTFP